MFRRKSTVTERVLWKRLRKNALDGLHFRRQHPIGSYIVDFGCVPIRLVIELDGHFHTDALRIPQDERRTQWLREHGYRVLRFLNDAAWTDIEGVLAVIRKVSAGTPPSPTLQSEPRIPCAAMRFAKCLAKRRSGAPPVGGRRFDGLTEDQNEDASQGAGS